MALLISFMLDIFITNKGYQYARYCI